MTVMMECMNVIKKAIKYTNRNRLRIIIDTQALQYSKMNI